MELIAVRWVRTHTFLIGEDLPFKNKHGYCMWLKTEESLTTNMNNHEGVLFNRCGPGDYSKGQLEGPIFC